MLTRYRILSGKQRKASKKAHERYQSLSEEVKKKSVNRLENDIETFQKKKNSKIVNMVQSTIKILMIRINRLVEYRKSYSRIQENKN